MSLYGYNVLAFGILKVKLQRIMLVSLIYLSTTGTDGNGRNEQELHKVAILERVMLHFKPHPILFCALYT